MVDPSEEQSQAAIAPAQGEQAGGPVYDQDSVSDWLRRLSQRDEEAAQRLWERYCERLVRLARKKLAESPRRVGDEEDVVLSAFNSFFQGMVAGRYPQLHDRDDLWRLLVAITANKAVDQRRRQLARKRGAGQVRGESALAAPEESGRPGGIEQILTDEPTPEMAAMVVEECERLLGLLGDESLRQVARLRLENYSVLEIAGKLDCSLRTVKRRLALIRSKWQETAR